MKKIVFMYSGQGSHFYRMGLKLYRANRVFNQWMDRLDRIALEIMGISITAEIYNPDKKTGNLFSRTLYTHPAIFMTEYALTQVLLDRGITPDLVLGASLGEFTAAAVSGLLDYREALEMVIKQAGILEDECEEGGMLAVMEEPGLYERLPLLKEHTVVAGINFDSHFVVTGKPDKLKEITSELSKLNKKYFLLPVSHGFHSDLIEPARGGYLAWLKSRVYKETLVPFISCCTARVEHAPVLSHFWDAVRQPIHFREAAALLEDEGYIFVDAGPSGTLSTFLSYLYPEKKERVFMIMTRFGNEEKYLDKLLSRLKRAQL